MRVLNFDELKFVAGGGQINIGAATAGAVSQGGGVVAPATDQTASKGTVGAKDQLIGDGFKAVGNVLIAGASTMGQALIGNPSP